MATPNVLTFSYTATDDLMFRVVQHEMWLRTANIHAVTNDAKYGGMDVQDATIAANAVVSFDDFNLADLFFKNAGAAANTTIYVVGIAMTEGRKRELGLI